MGCRVVVIRLHQRPARESPLQTPNGTTAETGSVRHGMLTICGRVWPCVDPRSASNRTGPDCVSGVGCGLAVDRCYLMQPLGVGGRVHPLWVQPRSNRALRLFYTCTARSTLSTVDPTVHTGSSDFIVNGSRRPVLREGSSRSRTRPFKRFRRSHRFSRFLECLGRDASSTAPATCSWQRAS